MSTAQLKTVAWLVEFESGDEELWPAAEFGPEGPPFGQETHALVSRTDVEALTVRNARLLVAARTLLSTLKTDCHDVEDWPEDSLKAVADLRLAVAGSNTQ